MVIVGKFFHDFFSFFPGGGVCLGFIFFLFSLYDYMILSCCCLVYIIINLVGFSELAFLYTWICKAENNKKEYIKNSLSKMK